MKDHPTRALLNQPIGEIITNFTNLSDTQRDAVLELQGRLVAIQEFEKDLPKEQRTDLYGVKTIEAADKIIEAKNIVGEVVAAGLSMAKYGVAVPAGVPLFGQVAVAMGCVAMAVKEVMLLAQAAERALLAYEGKVEGVIKDAFSAINEGNIDKATKALNDKMFGRPFIDKEKQPLQAAQAIQHLADIIAGFMTAKKDVKLPEKHVVAPLEQQQEIAQEIGMWQAVWKFLVKMVSAVAGVLSLKGNTNQAAPMVANVVSSAETKMQQTTAIPAAITTAMPALVFLSQRVYANAADKFEELGNAVENGIRNNAPKELKMLAGTILNSANDEYPHVIRNMDFERALEILKKSAATVVSEVRKDHPELGEKIGKIVDDRLRQAQGLQPEKDKSLNNGAGVGV